MNKELDRCKGALMGLAAGDALGTTIEFRPPGTFELMIDIVGGGVFGLEPGQWTDDMSMALCLADSLIEKEGFDPSDQLAKYVKWYREGYNSSTGECFDIGYATMRALEGFERSGQPFCGDPSRTMAGNGSIMRLAPIPMAYFNNPEELMEHSVSSSMTTHAAPQCLDACKYMASLIAGAINGLNKEELLSESFTLIPNYWQQNPMDPAISEIAAGSFKIKTTPQIIGSGYVVKTLEAALWAFYHTNDFESGALKAVNLGDDADTVGAVYGQIAGAFYGLQGIPEKWLKKIHKRFEIEIAAESLHALAVK